MNKSASVRFASDSPETMRKSASVQFASDSPETMMKSASVRFTSDSPETIEAPCDTDAIENTDAIDNEIKAEIQSYLPSNTLHRRKKIVLSVSAGKSFTFPRRAEAVAGPSLLKLSRSFLQRKHATREQHDVIDIDNIDFKSEDFLRNIEVPKTEEERIQELQAIRDLPLQMREKKLYRNAILKAMTYPQSTRKSQKKSFFAGFWFLSCFKRLKRVEMWNGSLKSIEGQFGTGVVSYFVLLRWLILLNFLIFILYFFVTVLPYSAFALLPRRNINIAPNTSVFTEEFIDSFPKTEVVPLKKQTKVQNVSLAVDGDLLSNLGSLLDNYLPEDSILDVTVRYDKRNYTTAERHEVSVYCEERYKDEMKDGSSETLILIQDFLQGTGWLQSTLLFLGFYSDRDVSYLGLTYNLSVAFLAALVVSFLLSIILMMQYSSVGIEESTLTRMSNYMTFSNILFCSWDYCIEDEKTATVRHKSITCEIKSNLADEHWKIEVSQWSPKKRMKVYILRAFFHLIALTLLFSSFYLIYIVVNFQLEKQRKNELTGSGIYTLCVQFLSPIVLTSLNIIMPIVFNNLGRFEMYDSQTQVNIALFRIVFLRLASVFVLVSTLHQQITCEPKDMCKAGLSEYCRTPICWETYVGQQLYKLVITDFLVYVFMFLGYDLPRDLFVTKCKCKLSDVMGRQIFDIPSQVLSLVYSQTLCWLGIFYSPLLSGITVLKFLIVFYIKKIVVLRHCTPAPVLYKAARSNSIFMTILMMSFFVIMVIHGYALTSIEPSPACSPFRQYYAMINAIPDALNIWSSNLVTFLNFIFSAYFFVPSFLLLSCVIYYYWTVIIAQKNMTKLLKSQITIEGHDKQFLLNRLAEAARQVVAN